MYKNASCPLIEERRSCMSNGRPYSWNSQNCELPHCDARRFLEFMRNKTLALIGDSISRNHVQSLLCMLSTDEAAVQVYRCRGIEDEDMQLSIYHLVYLVSFPSSGHQLSLKMTMGSQVHLDKLDKNWTDVCQSSDYAIISPGKWFNNTVVGCHTSPGRNLTEVGFEFPYKKALDKALDFISTTKNKSMVFYRMATPDHFEYGEWHNGSS